MFILRLGKALRDVDASLSIFTSCMRIVTQQGVGKLRGFLQGSIAEKIASTSKRKVFIVR